MTCTTLAPGHVVMRHDWTEARKGRPTGHGSVFRFDPARHGFLYDDLAANPYAEVEAARGSEQRYTSHKAMERGVFTYIPNDWVVPVQVRLQPVSGQLPAPPRLPTDARVSVFTDARRCRRDRGLSRIFDPLCQARPTGCASTGSTGRADLGDRWG